MSLEVYLYKNERDSFNKAELTHIAVNYATNCLKGYQGSFDDWFDNLNRDWVKVANKDNPYFSEIEHLECLYSANITHNLNEMADEAGIYDALWRPHRLVDGYNIPEGEHDAEYEFEKSVTIQAKDIIDIVEKGLVDLKNRPEHFKQFNSPNGWGLYKNFVPFVEKYLEALKEHPEAIIKISR